MKKHFCTNCKHDQPGIHCKKGHRVIRHGEKKVRGEIQLCTFWGPDGNCGDKEIGKTK